MKIKIARIQKKPADDHPRTAQQAEKQLPERPESIKVQKFLYVGKIIGIFWFDGNLPTSDDVRIAFYINPLDADKPNMSIFRNVERLRRSDARFISQKLQRPAWADIPETYKGNFTYPEFIQKWTEFI